MVCDGIEIIGSEAGIFDIISYPTYCDPYFYTKFIGAFWIILVSALFYFDQERTGKGDMISSMAIASIAVIFLSTIGTLVGLFSNPIFIQILVVNLIVIAFWFFRD